MTRASADGVPERSANQRPTAPATAERFEFDGLAITRRARPDVDPAKPLVVLVHGAMDRAASFGRVMRRLPDFEVVAYDRRGYGSSARLYESDSDLHHGAEPGSIASHGHDLLRVISHCLEMRPQPDAKRTAVVVGHSLGGLVALWAACADSSQIAGVGAFESPAPWIDRSFDTVGGGAVELAETEGNDAAGLFFYRRMIGDETFARLRSADREARRAEGDALVAELRSLRDPNQAFDLDCVAVPVVVGHGEASSPTMRRNADLMAGAIPGALRVTVNGATHGAHLTKPDGYAGYVRICVERSVEDMAR